MVLSIWARLASLGSAARAAMSGAAADGGRHTQMPARLAKLPAVSPESCPLRGALSGNDKWHLTQTRGLLTVVLPLSRGSDIPLTVMNAKRGRFAAPGEEK